MEQRFLEYACAKALGTWFFKKISELSDSVKEKESAIENFWIRRFKYRSHYCISFNTETKQGSPDVEAFIKQCEISRETIPSFDIVVDTRVQNLILIRTDTTQELSPMLTRDHLAAS